MSENVEARGLTFAQRRELGLTIPNIARTAKRLKQAGELSEDPDVAAAQIAAALAGENLQAFDDPSIDWTAILAFIEKLLPLILQIISIFSAI
jgi:hypothetical protein